MGGDRRDPSVCRSALGVVSRGGGDGRADAHATDAVRQRLSLVTSAVREGAQKRSVRQTLRACPTPNRLTRLTGSSDFTLSRLRLVACP
jgi:hypothetical protein